MFCGRCLGCDGIECRPVSLDVCLMAGKYDPASGTHVALRSCSLEGGCENALGCGVKQFSFFTG